MYKINGKQNSFAPIRVEGSRITICYGLKQLSGELYEWMEIYLSKKQLSQLTYADVKAAIIDDINERVRNKIISGFVWDNNPVWLSEENQLNFSQAVIPARLKIGEQEDGTPVYHDFFTKTELKAFNDACTAWRQQCLTEGYTEKDGIDMALYEAFFQQDVEQENGEVGKQE